MKSFNIACNLIRKIFICFLIIVLRAYKRKLQNKVPNEVGISDANVNIDIIPCSSNSHVRRQKINFDQVIENFLSFSEVMKEPANFPGKNFVHNITTVVQSIITFTPKCISSCSKNAIQFHIKLSSIYKFLIF